MVKTKKNPQLFRVADLYIIEIRLRIEAYFTSSKSTSSTSLPSEELASPSA